MSWDLVLMLATMALNIFIAPTLLNSRAHVPRVTSGPFAVAIAVIALALLQLDNPLGAAANALGALMWVMIFMLRGETIVTTAVTEWLCSGGPASECSDCQAWGRCPTC
mgnify:FL=1